MKRDNDLIRAILAVVEKHEGNRLLSLSAGMFVGPFPGLRADVLDEHIRLLVEAGFLKADEHQFGWSIIGLTWTGHDFIANAKCPTTWEKAKQVGGHLSFDVFTSVLKDVTLKSVQGLL